MFWLCCLPPPVCSVSVSHLGLSFSLFLSFPLSFPVSMPHSCLYARRCYESFKASYCVKTACSYGADEAPACCNRSPCPWTSDGRGRRQRASAMASCAQARVCPNLSPTDWHRRPPWWHGGAATFAYAPSAGASRASACAQSVPLERPPPTARRV